MSGHSRPVRPCLAPPAPFAGSGHWVFLLAVCGLGFSTIITQLTLMRELLSAFSGNEMVLGIALGGWLGLTGLGAQLGRTAQRLRRPAAVLVAAQIAVAALPIADVFALRALRNVVFVRGAMVGVTGTVLACLVLLLPYCLLAGYVLTLACRLLAREAGAGSIGRVYFLDSLGDILGGAAFVFVLVHVFHDHFHILYTPAVVNLTLAVAVAVHVRSRALLAATGGAAAALAAIVLAVDLDAVSTRRQYAGQEVVYRGSSCYGELVVARSAGQLDFIANGVPLFSTGNVEQVEEAVHYAMAQRPRAQRVLLISGGVSGTAGEILKYGPRRVDYVELDPQIVAAARRFLPGRLADERIRVIQTDGRLFVQRARGPYDVIIVDLPDPSTSQLNRFYTAEFFAEARRVLAPGGVLSLSVGQYANYVSEQTARMVSATHRTLRTAFAHVLMLPGDDIRLLASDGPLTDDIAGRIESAGVETRFVHRDYLEAALSPDRLADLARAVSADAPVNRDLGPILYYYHLRRWMSRFRYRFGLLEAVLALAVLAYLVRIRPVPLAIFTTGFAASSLTVVLVLAFQILCGSVYERLGWLVTAFMAGLAVGAVCMNRRLARSGRGDLVRLEAAVAAFAASVPVALYAIRGAGAASMAVGAVALPAMSFLLAVLVGMEFPVAGKVDFQAVTTTAARVYTADFVGACLGALLVSTFLVPILGVTWVCLLAGGLNALSGLVLWVTGRR